MIWVKKVWRKGRAYWRAHPWCSSSVTIAALLLIWLNLSVHYLITTRYSLVYQHDTRGHLEYSRLIAKEHRLPTPYRGWQTYHPPAYYLINQTAEPLSDHHIARVRLYSLGYGAVFLLFLFLLLSMEGTSPALLALVGLFFVTMPSTVQIFTAYNNDSLAMLCAGGVLFFSYGYLKKQQWWWLLPILFFIALGVYTKYTVVYAVWAVLGLLAVGVVCKQVAIKSAACLALPLLLGCMSLVPWLVFHNQHYTGRLLPHNAAALGSTMDDGRLRFFLAPPGIRSGEWNTPYAAEVDGRGRWIWVKKNLFSSVLVTTAMGEFEFATVPPTSPFHTFAWLVIGGQLVSLAVIIAYPTRKMLLPLVVCLAAFITHVLHLSFVHPFMNSANYRYYTWISLPYMLLLALALQQAAKKSGGRRWLPYAGLLSGIGGHVGFFWYFTL